jgi:arylformamidase
MKGPRVFLAYDQAELDAAYDQAIYAPNFPQIVKRYASNSAATRARLGQPQRVDYGPSAIEKLDILRTSASNAPIHFFIHGGAWRSSVAADYAFIAEPLVAAGAHVVIPDFTWVQDAADGLWTMAEQLRHAVIWVYRHAEEFGGDQRRIVVSAHSSGAHLAAVMLTSDWAKDDLPPDLFKAGLLISGLYELHPVALSARRNYVPFNAATEEALSAQRHIDRLRTPLVVAYGTCETPEFQRQSRDFAAAVAAAGKPVQLLTGENYNHFEMVETLANPFGLTGRAALAQLAALLT